MQPLADGLDALQIAPPTNQTHPWSPFFFRLRHAIDERNRTKVTDSPVRLMHSFAMPNGEIQPMRVLIAQFNIKPECLQDFETARAKILAALSHERPKGVRYIWCAIPNSTSFVGWLELDEGVDNPLPNMEAGKEFTRNIQSWVAAPPTRQELRLVGSYPPAS